MRAERLGRDGRDVALVTPAADVSNWTHNTLEQKQIQTRLLDLGVHIQPQRSVSAIAAGAVETTCVFTGRRRETPCDGVVLVTARLPEAALAGDLKAREADWAEAGIRSVRVLGDACAPGTIAMAVYAGRRYAEELDGPDIGDAVPFRRELTELAPL